MFLIDQQGSYAERDPKKIHLTTPGKIRFFSAVVRTRESESTTNILSDPLFIPPHFCLLLYDASFLHLGWSLQYKRSEFSIS